MVHLRIWRFAAPTLRNFQIALDHAYVLHENLNSLPSLPIGSFINPSNADEPPSVTLRMWWYSRQAYEQWLSTAHMDGYRPVATMPRWINDDAEEEYGWIHLDQAWIDLDGSDYSTRLAWWRLEKSRSEYVIFSSYIANKTVRKPHGCC